MIKLQVRGEKMSESICQFMPEKKYRGDIKTIHFVYETEFHTFNQPFFYSIFRLHLVTKGTAVLKIHDKTYDLKKGSLFFTFPASLYEIKASEDFEYYYISFMGSGSSALLEELGINILTPVYQGFEHLISFWEHSIKKINKTNITILTESVLLYTLSFINNEVPDSQQKSNDNIFEMLVDYIDNHYKDYDLSLKKLSDVFSYTEKYLSHLFKKHMNISFKTYLNKLRMQYAYELIENNNTSVSKIAELCGYSDSLYFSKVFKKARGITPTQYIKNRKNSH